MCALRKGLFLSCLLLPMVSTANEPVDFFRPMQAAYASISPMGTHVVLAEQVDGHAVVSLIDLSTNNQQPVFKGDTLLRGEESWILGLQWIDDSRVAIVASQNRDAIAELVDTRSSRSAYIVETGSKDENGNFTVYPIETDGILVSPLPEQAEEFLYARSGLVSRLFRINATELIALGARRTKRTLVDGGQFNKVNEVASYDGYVIRWFTDAEGDVRSVLAISAESGLVLDAYDADSGAWESIRTWRGSESDEDEEEEAESPVIPLATTDHPDEYYSVIQQEGQSDSLYRYNVVTGEKTLVYRHLTADVHRVLVDDKSGTIRGVGIVDQGELRFEYIDSAASEIVAAAQSEYPDHQVAIVDSDLQQQRFVMAAWSFSDPGRFVAWDATSGNLGEIAAAMPWIEVNRNADLVSGTAISHGLDIPYLLALPEQRNEPFPLVVLPHGGPIGLVDDRTYDPVTQFLLINGFAVLQVNYRGSSGFSDEFLEAGKKEFGGKILDDIMAAYELVSERPDISSSSCIAGGSYGGYAALALGARYPDKFQCIASIAGVTDVNLVVSSPQTPAGTREWEREFFGDSVTEFEALAAISPAYDAERIEKPVFLAHGIDDRIVDVEHAYRMKDALDRAGKSSEFHILDDTGHSIIDSAVAAELYTKLVTFLQAHLQTPQPN